MPASTPDQLQAITRAYVNQQIHCVIAFEGHLDVQALRSALRGLMHVEPGLACRFRVVGLKACWEHRDDTDALEYLRVEYSEDPFGEVTQYAAMRTLAERDPLVQALLIRSKTRDTLCVKVNHVVSDAAGVKAVLGLLAGLYTRYLADPGYQPPEGSFRERGGIWDLMKKAGLLQTLKAIPMGIPLFPKFQLPRSEGGDAGGDYAIRTIDAATFGRIRRGAKDRGVTINDVLLTAFFRSLCSTLHPPRDVPLRIQVSVDLRHLLAKDELSPVCNLCGALYPALCCFEDEPFEATLGRFKARMDTFKKENRGLGSIVLASGLLALGYQSGEWILLTGTPSTKTYPLFSNTGVIDDRQLVFGDVPVAHACILGPIILDRWLMVVASTFRDTLTLSTGYARDAVDPACIARLMDAMAEEISRIA